MKVACSSSCIIELRAALEKLEYSEEVVNSYEQPRGPINAMIVDVRPWVVLSLVGHCVTVSPNPSSPSDRQRNLSKRG